MNNKGIQNNNKNTVMSQFADDHSIILDGSEMDLQTTPQTIIEFGKCSRLQINVDKTQVVTWIGVKNTPHLKLHVCSNVILCTIKYSTGGHVIL